jgi:hypothetical protein
MRPKRSAKPKLGRLEKIEPVNYWQSDADFLDWLAEPENLELLAESLELELTPVAADGDEPDADSHYILCEDPATEAWVLVLPQITAADAPHLGQLMMDAAQVEAATVVWVAAAFGPETVQTLYWLTQVTNPHVAIEGVEVELWRIGKNAMAANFHRLETGTIADGSDDGSTAAVLNDDENDAAEPAEPEPEPLTEQQQENLDFWTGLCQQLDRRGSVIKPGAPTTEPAMGFAIARADFRLYAILDRDHNSLHTELLLSGADAHPHFYLLAHERALVEDEIGYPLIWDDSGKHTCAIACSLADVDITDLSHWEEYQAWFCHRLEQLYDVFYDRIKHLDAATYQPLPNYDAEPLTDSFILPASGRG